MYKKSCIDNENCGHFKARSRDMEVRRRLSLRSQQRDKLSA